MLSDIRARNAKGVQRLWDEKGLYLQITKAGSKLWRYKYRFNRKEKLLALGRYPEVGLKDARARRDEARRLLADGIDPGAHRKAKKTAQAIAEANTFEAIAREWHDSRLNNWAKSHSATIIRRLEKDIFPWLGNRPMSEITAPELLSVIRRVEDRGALETAHRELNICGQVFRYAIATARAERDPSADLRGALPPVKTTHMAAVTDPTEFGDLLRLLDNYQGTLVVKCALRLAPLVFVRPGELRHARWADIHLEQKLWSFELSKKGGQHIVPLSRQAIAILEDIQPLTGQVEWVFPSGRSPQRPMSENGVLAALRTLGIPKDQMSGHGFRAAARTLLDEQLHFRPDLIEQQLGHRVKDPLGRAYNRTKFLDERKQMMQDWADYLEKLKGVH